MGKLSHLDQKGRATMVDVTAKAVTKREARARGMVIMHPDTLQLLVAGKIPKGDVFNTARIAGIMAAKKTSGLIPLCHPLELTDIDVCFKTDKDKGAVILEAKVSAVGKTGVEMEAMTAVSVAALTIYDMCKSADKGIILSDIKLMEKHGGKSGAFIRTS